MVGKCSVQHQGKDLEASVRFRNHIIWEPAVKQRKCLMYAIHCSPISHDLCSSALWLSWGNGMHYRLPGNEICEGVKGKIGRGIHSKNKSLNEYGLPPSNGFRWQRHSEWIDLFENKCIFFNCPHKVRIHVV